MNENEHTNLSQSVYYVWRCRECGWQDPDLGPKPHPKGVYPLCWGPDHAREAPAHRPVLERSPVVLRELLDDELEDMALHDDTGDPFDKGYMEAVDEIRRWLAPLEQNAS